MEFGLMKFLALFFISLNLFAAQYRLEWTSQYHHEWNWNLNGNETIRVGNCDEDLITKWSVIEKNEGDFWKSVVSCNHFETDGSISESESSHRDHFEYSGNGSLRESGGSHRQIPVGVKLQYKTVLGKEKLIDYTLINLSVTKAASCETGTNDAGWATHRTSGNHQIVKLFCNCGAMTNLDVIEKKPAGSGGEITGVKVTCRRVLRY